ncbi:hypothetical protein [Mycolicibacterium sp. HK-90]|uniref:hypothetical protein n=1 Tax=Mycolicibacterium sp. HK-90 TaxID=3056937 RepID=UPI00265AD750|nr:hypothetical protein [Mycolicibacterium sp. HK-90]WKG03063.1 hypothetical protein QU592_28405 [Mycolicibacterium sp. HK-90]
MAPVELERLIADMSDVEFDTLVARVRAPDTREHLREIAAAYVPAEVLDEFIDALSPSKFVHADGRVDVDGARLRFAAFFPSAAAGLSDLDADIVSTMRRATDA